MVSARSTEHDDESLSTFALNYKLRHYTLEPGRLERFYLKFVIVKFIAIAVCMGLLVVGPVIYCAPRHRHAL